MGALGAGLRADFIVIYIAPGLLFEICVNVYCTP